MRLALLFLCVAANKGVLFETVEGHRSNEPWEDRLYHGEALKDMPAAYRGLAVILEIDSFRNEAVDLWLNTLEGDLLEERYKVISDAIAEAILEAL